MRLRTLLPALALVAGCASNKAKSDAPPPSPDEARVLELEQDFERHIEESALPSSTEDAQQFQGPLVQKSESMKALLEQYAPFAGSDDPVAKSHAALRVAQLYFNLGCELATLGPPATLTAEQETVYRGALMERAAPLLEKGKQALDAANQTGGGQYSDKAAELASSWNDDAGQFCAATTDSWAAANRPEAPPPTEASCLDSKFIRVNQRCVEIYAETCAAGKGTGCYYLGLLHHEADELDEAAAQFTRGCEAEHALSCHAEAATPVPGSKQQYISGCKAGNAVNCMQLAQLSGGIESVDEVCTSRKGLGKPRGETLANCTEGDARACWSRAGKLIDAKPYELPPINISNVFGVGGLGMRGTGPDDESREERMKRLEKECSETTGSSCVALGKMLEEDGENPITMYRRGCQLGNDWGCSSLATALLDKGDRNSVGEALAVLKSACGDEKTGRCRRLAELFRQGEKVEQSDGCAAAYMWQTCEPDAVLGCEDLNRLFHPPAETTEGE